MLIHTSEKQYIQFPADLTVTTPPAVIITSPLGTIIPSQTQTIISSPSVKNVITSLATVIKEMIQCTQVKQETEVTASGKTVISIILGTN